jgi:hypothetical protein
MQSPGGQRLSELELFAGIVRHLVQRDGFPHFLPTVFLPARGEVRILDDTPPDGDHQQAALRWAAERTLPDEEVLVAFQVDASRFRIVRRAGPVREEGLFDIDGEAGGC